ncbi:MAG: chitobiase/beta-hexosaminidase C-terminal domain-containing protein [Mogibacterium sp.]|nr:chitobiase/beta-hexosaminidase C-terminal domain-containing protein [Mogibacterium sp.]
MKTYSDTDRIRIKATMKATIHMAMVVAVFLAAFFWIGSIQIVYAEGTDLTIKKDGEVVKEFTLEELEQIAAEEGNKICTYSAWNTFPTFDKKTYASVTGPTVDAVLKKAGVRDAVTDTGTVTFSDGSYGASFTGNQLFNEKRYCFPNGGLADPKTGAVPDESYADASEVEAVIYLTGGKDGNVLCVGQAAPNDENKPAFTKYLATIEIKTTPASRCAVPESVPADRSICKKGEEIVLNGTGRSMEYIYYTLDGSEPDYGSTIYNSGMNQGTETRPVLPNKYGVYHLKVKVKAYGKLDSEVADFRYYVGPSTEKPTLKLTAGKRKVTVRWSRVSGATGYVIYRSTKKSSGFKAVKTIKKGGTLKYVNKKLKKGKRYYYKVRAYRTMEGRKVYGRYSAVKSTRAK